MSLCFEGGNAHLALSFYPHENTQKSKHPFYHITKGGRKQYSWL